MIATDSDLLHGNPDDLAAYLGCTRRTINRYKSGEKTLPEACRKLLRMRFDGDLSALLGDAWDGFRFSREGKLFVPGWANGMCPHQLRAMFFVYQEAAALRGELKQMRAHTWARDNIRRLAEFSPATRPRLPATSPVPNSDTTPPPQRPR